MSSLSITPYFPFPRIKVTKQTVIDATAIIEVRPNLRFSPICSQCGTQGKGIHDNHNRKVRDMNIGDCQVYLDYHYRRIKCPQCQRATIEELGIVAPYARLTQRLASHTHHLCKKMTVQDVAEELHLDWKTVKNTDKEFLERQFGETDYSDLEILSFDEISLKKRQYLTVGLDYLHKRVVWIGQGREANSLIPFFSRMPQEIRQNLKAVAIDMWPAFISAVRHWCPRAVIVFDFFHVVRDFNIVINKVRNQEIRKANAEEKKLLKGSRYLFLKNDEKLTPRQKCRLDEILKLNANLNAIYILKDALKLLYAYQIREKADELLQLWCLYAQQSAIPEAIDFGRKLQRHRYGILNHCDYPISTGKLEGINNAIKVIKRKAYGFRDERYFILKVKQAFDGSGNTW